LAHGTDSRVVFMRERITLEPNKVPFGGRSLSLSHKRHQKLTLAWSTVTVGFCGKTYRAIKVKYSSAPGTPLGADYIFDKVKVFYDAETFNSFCAENEIEPHFTNVNWWVTEQVKTNEGRLAKYFENQGSTEMSKYMIDNKFVTLVIEHGLNYSAIQVYAANCTLKEYEFFRVLNAFQAYQEIDMFISGSFTTPDVPMIELTEKDRIAQHGFDKYSFKHKPK
jgi:hypothetical protein